MPRRVDPETGKGFMFKNRVGERNGRLVFTKFLGLTVHKHSVWEAQCDCGNLTQTSSPNKTKSCGCLQREMAAKTQLNKKMPSEQKDKSRKISASKQRELRKSNPLAVMQGRLSRLHRHALMQVGAIKSSPTFSHLGYTVEEFVNHIEKQFVKGMSWSNMNEWQIDHIIPVSEAKTVDDVVALNQLYNLRPMWSSENNAKKNRRTTLL